MDIACLTSQFPHCGNAFRADLYRWCTFGCVYCFAQNRQGKFTNQKSEDKATIPQIDKLVNSKGIVGELIKNKVPMHCGGMADPFQPIEFELGLTKQFIRNFTEYPIMFSTKTDYLPDEYFEYLNPKYHVFQLSIIGLPDDKIRLFEKNAPLTDARLKFAEYLKALGFTVFIRIQPLITLEWARYIVKNAGNIVDGFTVEHLKFPLDNKNKCDQLIKICADLGIIMTLEASGREYEVSPKIKYRNIIELKSMERKAFINTGDNDLRLLSENVNCCGLDVCPKSFSNWLKHNSMAIKKTGNWDNWIPKEKCTAGLNSTCIINGYGYADYVKRNYVDNYGEPLQMGMELEYD